VARLELDAPPDSAVIRTCRVAIEDDRQRLFSADPTDELDGSEGTRTEHCRPAEDSESRYFSSSFFALPRDAKPVAVRVTIDGRAAFARLPVP